MRFTPRGAILAIAGLFDWKNSSPPSKIPSAHGNPSRPRSPPKSPLPAAIPTSPRRPISRKSASPGMPSPTPIRIPSSCRRRSTSSPAAWARAVYGNPRKAGPLLLRPRRLRLLEETRRRLRLRGHFPRPCPVHARLLHRRTPDASPRASPPDELDRAKIGMKSRVIMQGDSTGARSGAIAYDFYHRARTRTLDEMRDLIESVTLPRVNDFLAANPVKELTLDAGPASLAVTGYNQGSRSTPYGRTNARSCRYRPQTVAGDGRRGAEPKVLRPRICRPFSQGNRARSGPRGKDQVSDAGFAGCGLCLDEQRSIARRCAFPTFEVNMARSWTILSSGSRRTATETGSVSDALCLYLRFWIEDSIGPGSTAMSRPSRPSSCRSSRNFGVAAWRRRSVRRDHLYRRKLYLAGVLEQELLPEITQIGMIARDRGYQFKCPVVARGSRRPGCHA